MGAGAERGGLFSDRLWRIAGGNKDMGGGREAGREAGRQRGGPPVLQSYNCDDVTETTLVNVGAANKAN